ncbi:type II toxin-antitoxin system RelE/ParE family toxin [Aminobacter aganoensis]|uniref:Plasmid stabilization system protein ParE n=1 Tax=Aminobacter aganoensis TaxID=83264 RepID=A0A7X0KLM5_9HYPH|nr:MULTISPECIES: type II toxin-antitoxin system RelE/ParE family toxin [Aminobacter]KQU64819.1 hypothetical protein ASC75_12425 [Aminobacter sp. DSM 101952]MBB6355198.1 plasmid stabilization system protein ParE [Aminobacter aganoensis]
MKIRLTKAAIRDLREAQTHIAADSEEAARQLVLRLDRAITLPGEKPTIGRPTSEKAIREWSVPGLPFLIPYRIADDAVEIIRLFHTSRMRPPHWL